VYPVQALVIVELFQCELTEGDRPHLTYLILQYYEEIEYDDNDDTVDTERDEVVLSYVT